MGILSWAGRRLGLTDGANWSAFVGSWSHAGKAVNLDTAMQLSAVWACVRANAQAVSSMPCKIYRKGDNGSREEVVDHPLAAILQDSPNEDQTPLEFWESMVSWMLVNGNAYAEKVTTGSRLSALRMLPADQVCPARKVDDTLVYRITDRGKTYEMPREKIFHVKGFGFGGDVGLSPIRFGVQTLGAAIAADEVAGKFFANGMQAAGVLSSDQILKKEQREQLQEHLKTFTGSEKANKVLVLEAGLKYSPLSLNPEDAQLLETRRFSVEDVARWFGTPPIVIGHAATGVTVWGSGVEQILLSWLTLGLDPLADRIEARIRKQLIPDTDRRRMYAEFNREALLQMDSTAKANFLSTMVNNGLLTRNEGRAKLNFPRAAGGDQLTVQSALVPLDQLGKQPSNGAPTAPPRTEGPPARNGATAQ
jgi:HK97 family phage portal protein